MLHSAGLKVRGESYLIIIMQILNHVFEKKFQTIFYFLLPFSLYLHVKYD